MISTNHGFIRTTDPDDAPALSVLYRMQPPRAALLDQRREPLMPTKDELRELLGRKEATQGAFFTIEDTTGAIKGFCGLRGMNQEAAFGEITLMPLEESFFHSELARDAYTFLYRRAFENLRLYKLLAHCLDTETALRAFLLEQGFAVAGTQREIFFGQGRWHDVHLLALAAPKMARGAG